MGPQPEENSLVRIPVIEVPAKPGCVAGSLLAPHPVRRQIAFQQGMGAARGSGSMGILVNGVWRDERLAQETAASGDFLRADSAFRDRVTADGSSGFKAEAGRYHLYVTFGCPWAHRTLLMRAVKQLDSAISVTWGLPDLRDYGWTFEKRDAWPDCTADEVNGFHYLHEAYAASKPDYTGKVTVPTLWDKKTKRIVNNESSEIIRMLNSAFVGTAGNDKDFYPQALRDDIDKMNAKIYATVNNGVYRCGFAQSQEAYEKAFDDVFTTLDELEGLLGRQRYLCGAQLTEADWRLLPTLVRFDVAYFPLFKCNRQRIADYHNLSNYMRELCQYPGVMATIKPRQYIANYYSITRLNPSGIVPKGTPVDYAAPHDRDKIMAKPVV
jgi:putative glutathione S-transferase